jgi:hypothetical protein
LRSLSFGSIYQAGPWDQHAYFHLVFAIRRAQEIPDGSYRPTNLDLALDPSVDDCRSYLRRHLAAHGDRFDLLVVDIEISESAKLDEEELAEAG